MAVCDQFFDFEVITLNCQGLQNSAHHDTLFSWLQCCHVDVLCLQETHAISMQEFMAWLATASSDGLNKVGYKCVSSPGANRSAGVAILYRPEFDMIGWSGDQSGRFVRCELAKADQHLQICNVYGPNQAKEGAAFFNSLPALIDPDTPTVLCGDFNTVVDAHLNRFGCNPLSSWAYNWPTSLASLVETLDLHDAWRLQHPTTKEYTWRCPNGTQGSRLDMFWLSAFLLTFILQVDILPFFRSNHAYVYLKLALPPSVHLGHGLWKFNVTHLSNDTFAHMVTNFWKSRQLTKRPSLLEGAH